MIRAALIETDGWGEVHLEQMLRLRKKGLLEIVGAYDPDPGQRKLLSALGVVAFEDPDEMLGEMSPDFVTVATDVSLHRRFCELALKHDVAVFCDCPAAATEAEVRSMIDLRDRSSAPFALVAFESIYTRSVQTIKAIVLSRCYGALRSVSAIGAVPCGDSYYRGDFNVCSASVSGGSPVAVSPITCTFSRYLNIALFCLGRSPDHSSHVLSVKGELLRARKDIVGCDSCLLRFETDVGIPLNLAFSYATSSTIRGEVVFRFEHATLRWNYRSWSVEDLEGHLLRTENEADPLEQAYQSIVRLVSEGVPTYLVCSLEAAVEQVMAVELTRKELPIRDMAPSEVKICPEYDGAYLVPGMEERLRAWCAGGEEDISSSSDISEVDCGVPSVVPSNTMKSPLQSFDEAVDQYVLSDPRYPVEAYYFIRDGFDYSLRHLPEPSPDDKFAKLRAEGMPVLTGRDLALGLRDFALDEYGPMASFTLRQWNIVSTSDFGELVFNLIKMGRFSQNEGDKKSDFDDVFDFEEAFRKPYEE